MRVNPSKDVLRSRSTIIPSIQQWFALSGQRGEMTRSLNVCIMKSPWNDEGLLEITHDFFSLSLRLSSHRFFILVFVASHRGAGIPRRESRHPIRENEHGLIFAPSRTACRGPTETIFSRARLHFGRSSSTLLLIGPTSRDLSTFLRCTSDP